MGQLDVPYAARVTVNMDDEDHPTFSFNEQETFKNVLFVDAQASVASPKDAVGPQSVHRQESKARATSERKIATYAAGC